MPHRTLIRFLCFFSVAFLELPAHSLCQTVDDSEKVLRMMAKVQDTSPLNPVYGLHLARDVVADSRKINFRRGIEIGMNAIGNVGILTGDIKTAFEYYDSALKINADGRDVKEQRNATAGIADVYVMAGNFDKALELYGKALKMSEAMNDTLGIAITYSNISNCYANTHAFDEANKNAFRALDIYKKLKRLNYVSAIYTNVANNYIDAKRYTEAIYYIHRGDSLNFDHDPQTDYFTNLNMGICYKALNKKDSAFVFFTEALQLARKSGDKDGEIPPLSSIGELLTDRGNFVQAGENLQQALQLAHEVGNKKYIYEILIALANLYSKQHDYKKGFDYEESGLVAYDSLINENKAKALATQTALLETHEIENKNKLLEEENKVQRLRLQHKDFLVYAGFGASALFLLIGVLLVRQSRLKANQQRMELEQKQLLAQINPHFIFNCLNSIQQFVVQNDTMNANKYLADFALLMRQTLDNSKDGVISLRREIEYLENYLSFESMRFEDKFKYAITCDQDVNIDMAEIPSMIIQPFVENAIRHGLFNLEDRIGQLFINFHVKEKHLICEVDDNGIGMEEARRIKEQRLIKYQSHGMELTRKRLALVSKMHSDDYVISIIDKKDTDGHPAGTTIIIKFPLNT